MYVNVYKPDINKSFEYIARVTYYDRKADKKRLDPEIYAFDNYKTLAEFLREKGLLYAGRSKDDPPELLETWI